MKATLESLIQKGEHAESGVTCKRWNSEVFEYLRLTYGPDAAEDFRSRTDCDNEFDALRSGIGYLQGLIDKQEYSVADRLSEGNTSLEVLISWSGRQSRAVALGLHIWLPKVLPTLRPWISTQDIDKGTRWSNELQNYLARAQGSIICLTPENIVSPWVYWETGAISQTQRFPICPLLIGISPEDIKGGPLNQFQCTFADKEDVLLLVTSLNQRLEVPEDELRLRGLFEHHWDELRQVLDSAREMGIPHDVLALIKGLEEAKSKFRRRWDTDKRAASWDPIKQLITETVTKIEKLLSKLSVEKRAQMHCAELKEQVRSIIAASSREVAHERGDGIFPLFDKAVTAIRADYENR